jgi:hypothetical protein
MILTKSYFPQQHSNVAHLLILGQTLLLQEPKEAVNGSMHDEIIHTCDYDGHTAILIATAKILSKCKQLFNGKVKFIFQSAERKKLYMGLTKPF